MPWSPIARGRLAWPFGTKTSRTSDDAFGAVLYDNTADVDRKVIDTVEQLAARHGRSMAQVALAWVRQKPDVAAPIIGASSTEQLEDLIGGLDFALAAEEIAELALHYVPHALVGQE
ncbi:aldo/keto reductase [Pararhizobium polonicum]|uniref:aldo/keto reductase n=1 Tax=Pararhizobium polonicum TaxID=1612624 RepID=UPI0009F6D27B|nr:aldo/keto reductase [Pararhizobium polonicum]